MPPSPIAYYTRHNRRKWTKDEASIHKSLEAFNLFRVRQPSPMILSIMREYEIGGLKNKQVEDVLKAIENFHFMFTAVTSQRSSGGISQMYASLARRLLSTKNQTEKIAVLRELKTKLKDKLPSYQEFEANFCEIRFSDTYTKRKKLVQYILRRFDSPNSNGISLDYELMTIEDLAAQNAKTGNLIQPTHIAQLGNLVLVNEELNNKLSNRVSCKSKQYF